MSLVFLRSVNRRTTASSNHTVVRIFPLIDWKYPRDHMMDRETVSPTIDSKSEPKILEGSAINGVRAPALKQIITVTKVFIPAAMPKQ
jgi:hypothetical protein